MAGQEESMEQLTGMGFTPEQCTLALGVARGSVEGALQILLNPEILELITSSLARRGGALGPRLGLNLGDRPDERDPAPPGVEVSPESMAALMEMGYPPVRCSKSLFQSGGDVERAAMYMLENSHESDEFWIFTPDELAWAIESRQAGLEHQLEMLCSRPDLLLSGSGQVQVSLLQLLQSRPVGAAHPWACRAINAFGDRGILFRSNVRRILMDCLGVDADPERALSSESLDSAVVSTLQRIYLDPEFRHGARDHVAMIDRLLALVGAFCNRHPRSKLPAACETALEFCKTLCDKPDTRLVRDHPQAMSSIIGCICALLGHEDGSALARLGALECVAGIVKAQDWSEKGEALLHRLVTSHEGRLARLLLRLLVEWPDRIHSATEDDVYGLTCAVLAALCVASPKVLRELCSELPTADLRASAEVDKASPEGIPIPDASTELEPEPELRAELQSEQERVLAAVPDPEPEVKTQLDDVTSPLPEVEVVAPAVRDSQTATDIQSGVGPDALDFVRRSGGGILGCVVLALQNGCGDELCALCSVLCALLFDGYEAARAELSQHNGPFYVGEAVQGRDSAASSEYLPGTVISSNGNGTYDVQWENGDEPTTLSAVHLRRINISDAARGSPRAVGDLLNVPKTSQQNAGRLGRDIMQHRHNFLQALLPALLKAHERKSSVHQRFLSVLITTMEKVQQGSDSVADAGSGNVRARAPSVRLEMLTEDIALLDDARTVVAHETTFGTVVASASKPKCDGKWYYEVRIGGSSYAQIGFVLSTFSVFSGSGDGVGDDAVSWAYDGWRQKIWHGGLPGGNQDYATHIKWQAGSIVGCLLDLDEDEISFSLNGEVLGVAFRGIKEQLAAHGAASGARGIFPGATFTAGQHEMRFNESECEHAVLGFQLFERPPSSFDLFNTPPNVELLNQATAASWRQGRLGDCDSDVAAVIRCADPLVPLQLGSETSSDSDSYFEVTIHSLDEATDVSIGVLVAGCNPAGEHVGMFKGSVGYYGCDGCVYGENTKCSQTVETFGQGDTMGCGIVAGDGGSDRIFWTKNGRVLDATAETSMRQQGSTQSWYAAVGLTAQCGQIQANFGLTDFLCDPSALLGKLGIPNISLPEIVAKDATTDTSFVPQLMRTTRELLQSDTLTSILLALRLTTVALKWDRRSYALLRRQDVVRRVHALATCGDMPASIASQPRPKAVVCHNAAAVLSVIDHMADGEPPEAQLGEFCKLAARIRSGDDTGVTELAVVMDSSDGITEFEFEEAGFAGALSEFIAVQGVHALRRIFGGGTGMAGSEHFEKLVRMLQGVVACTDTLPVYHVPSDMRGRGSGLSCLLNPLKVTFSCDPSDQLTCTFSPTNTSELIGMFEPITPMRELEQFVLRHVVCCDPRFEKFCRELVGCRIEEKVDTVDGWRAAHVISYDSSSGRHSILYENGNGGTPLVRRLLSSCKYRIVRSCVEPSQDASAAEDELRAKELDAERKQAKKKKSWWGRKTTTTEQTMWVPQRGSRVGIKSMQTNTWEPGTVISTTESGRAEVVRDNCVHSDSLAYDRILQLDAPAPGDGTEVQWQWFDGQWWNFSVLESEHLEAARSDPTTTWTELQREVRYVLDFASMTQRDTSTGQECPIRRASTCDLWRELAPEGQRAEGEKQELGQLEPLSEVHTRSHEISQQLSLRVTCGFAGLSMAGRAGHLVQRDGPWTNVAMGDLNSNMTLFQCLMKATDMLDILTDDGGRSSSRILVPWQCSINITYRVVVQDAATKCPIGAQNSLVSVPPIITQPHTPSSRRQEMTGMGTDDNGRHQQVVVVYENERCNWTPSGDPQPEHFSTDALMRTDRHQWSDANAAPLPSPALDPLPPHGWSWLGEWIVAEWEYARDWDCSFSPHVTVGAERCWVRRRRWQRQLTPLAGSAQDPPTSAPVEIVRNIQELGNSPFIQRWGLNGSPTTVAERMGPRLAQALRDLQGDSFVLNEHDGTSEPAGGASATPTSTVPQEGTRCSNSSPPNGLAVDCSIPRSFSQLNLASFAEDVAERDRHEQNDDVRWKQALRSTSSAFQNALMVLAQMHRDDVLRNLADPGSWQSAKLAYKMRDQLSDPLTLVSGAMPAWCECLMFGARFLFPLDLRELYFRCTSFGPSRAVAWLKKRQPHAFDPVGALKVDRWLIRRENFLEQAYILMSHHAKRRTMLQVEFEGPLESGIGSGVHVTFFTDAASLLESWTQNCLMSTEHGVPMWINDSESRDSTCIVVRLHHFLPLSFQNNTTHTGHDTDSAGPLMCELYPHSLLHVPEHAAAVHAVCRRYSLLGWLFAKALMDQQLDERLLPLRLSPVFIDLVLGRLRLENDSRHPLGANVDALPFERLSASQIKGGAQVKLLLQLWRQVRSGELGSADANDLLEDYCVCMVDPATGGIPTADGGITSEIALCPGGDTRVVTADTLGEFFHLLAHSWFGEGVCRQVAAFSEAVRQVLPLERLLAFTTAELLEIVCGESVHWDAATLRDCVIPGDGYTGDDPPYQWLLSELEAMSAPARKDFLKFVTARVRLPSGGLRALSRKIEIRRSSNIDCVPHGHTCALALDLPPYRTQTELHVMLFKALDLMNNFDTGLYD